MTASDSATGQNTGNEQSTGVLASIRSFAASLMVIAHTRLELLANEVEEEKLRFGRLLIFGAIALFSFAVGVVFFAVFITVLLWDGYRLIALGGFAALFIGTGIAAVLLFRSYAAAGNKLFSASLGELNKDRGELLP